MARGITFGSFYGSTSGGFRVDIGETGGVASLILNSNNIPHEGIVGDPLNGYDIKVQDCTSMLKLSLLAETGGTFREVYSQPDGVAIVVDIGQSDSPEETLGQCLVETSISNFQNKIDHVIVRGSNPLPTRYYKQPVNVMGDGTVTNYKQDCTFGYSTKSNALGKTAVAEFERSQQSPETQELLKDLVKRSEWESLVGYKISFTSIPQYASMSPSQTTPKFVDIPITNTFATRFTLPLGDPTPYEGGVVNIAGVSVLGSPVLDLIEGPDLLASFPELEEQEPGFDYTEGNYYVLLNHECNEQSVSQGQNWFLLPGPNNTATVQLRPSGGSLAAWEIFYGFSNTTYFFRRKDNQISSISDMVKFNQAEGSVNPLLGLGNSATFNPFHGHIIPGVGGDYGMEVLSGRLAYTIAKPSIQVQSPYGDAFSIAQDIAAGGVTYTPLVIQDKPAPIALNGVLIDIPTPAENEGEKYEVDSAIDNLAGSIVDLSAPFLNGNGAAQLSANIFSAINSDSASYSTYSFVGGGHTILPGQSFRGGTVHSIEYSYQDKDSLSTNITTGPFYYPIGSYSDSKYVKRSETIQKDAILAAGSNSSGEMLVTVPDLGRYNAINTITDPVYPGDRISVKIMNVPVEKD